MLEQVRSEVGRRRRELDLLAQKPFTRAGMTKKNSAEGAIAQLDLQPAAGVPARVRLRDLLQYDDRRFVEYAYRCLLNRPMDSGGEWYVERLRQGKSKIDVLLHIRFGREGKDRGVRVRGLRILRTLSRLKHLPVLGLLVHGVVYVSQLAWFLATLPLQRREDARQRQRVMSLFTMVEDHVNAVQTHVGEAVDELASACRGVQTEIRRFVERETASQSPSKEIGSPLIETAASREELDQIAERVGQLESARARPGGEERPTRELDAVRNELEALSQRIPPLEAARAKVEEVSQRLLQIEEGAAGLVHHSKRLTQVGAMQVELDLLSRRLDRLAPVPSGDDGFYADLEDRFRGSTEEICKRQEFYVPFIQAAGAGTAEAPVADLGCGRGEWLGLLRDHGLTAYGVEQNTVFLDRCDQENLALKREDVFFHLESVPPASLGAITGFHIIEHLPANQQIRLVQLAFRALRPGGVLILETPNPEHLSVAALRFYVDPTHVRPVPAVLLQFIAEHAGFREIRIERRSPSRDGEASQGWSQYQDYALIAVRPRDL